MTPMIDVIFNLLIFFVCTASFQEPERLLPTHLSAPGGNAGAELPNQLDPEFEDVIIKVRLRGGLVAWEINNQPYERLEQVRGVLAALVAIKADVPVILDVEGEVPLGDAIDLYDLCRVVGFEKIQFAANIEQP